MTTIVVPYRDVNAQNKAYMMQLAQMMGNQRKEKKQAGQMSDLAMALDPQPRSTINNQMLMSDQGFDALRSNVLDDTPAQFGQVPGQPLTPQQVVSKALSFGLSPGEAVGLARTAQPQPAKRRIIRWQEKGGRQRSNLVDDVNYNNLAAQIEGAGGTVISGTTGKPPPGKVYDVKTIEKYLFDITTQKDTGDPRKPTKNEIFTVKQMAKASGYKVRKITLQQAKKKKFLGIDVLWPDQKEKTQWVLEKADTGEIVLPETKEIDAATAQSILAEAGGDREEARRIAKERGFVF